MRTNDIVVGFSDGGSFTRTLNNVVTQLIANTPLSLDSKMEDGGKITITVEELGDHFKWDMSKLRTVRNLLTPEEWRALMAIASTKKKRKSKKKKSSSRSSSGYIVYLDRPRYHGGWGGHHGGGHHGGGSGSGGSTGGSGSGSGSTGGTGGGTDPGGTGTPIVRRGSKFYGR